MRRKSPYICGYWILGVKYRSIILFFLYGSLWAMSLMLYLPFSQWQPPWHTRKHGQLWNLTSIITFYPKIFLCSTCLPIHRDVQAFIVGLLCSIQSSLMPLSYLIRRSLICPLAVLWEILNIKDAFSMQARET